jgi:hypothetical protein
VDNSPVSWGPQPALVVVGWLGAALALAATFLYEDRVGAVLLGLAAVALIALSAHGMLVRPRLLADDRGIRIRTARGSLDFSWPEADTRLRTSQRMGRNSTTLEISAGDHLFVFGWLELGTDPQNVQDVLTALRG